MSSLLQILGIEEDPNKRPARNPDPTKGEYWGLKHANTQFEDHGKHFTSYEAKNEYEAEAGITKICPACLNDLTRRCNCSRCNNTGRVPLYDGVFF